LGTINYKKEVFAGIRTDVVKLSLESEKKEKKLYLNFHYSNITAKT
jgi:hypothetical protein